jgi:hypothetical protein
MKKIYALADGHFNPIPREVQEKILNDERYTKLKEVVEFELKTEKKRYNKISRFLAKYEPEVMFLEGVKGTRTEQELRESGYGDLIFLDDGCKFYEEYMNERQKIDERFSSQIREVLDIDPKGEGFQPAVIDERKKIICEILTKHEKKLEELDKKFSDYSQREEYWAEIISKNYVEPSGILCGAAHLMDGLNALKIMLYSLPHCNAALYIKNIVLPLPFFGELYLLLKEKRKGKIAILSDILREKEIDIEVTGYLPGDL